MLCFQLVKETVFIVFKQVFNFVDSLPNDCTGPPQLWLHRGFNIKMMFRACVCLFYFIDTGVSTTNLVISRVLRCQLLLSSMNPPKDKLFHVVHKVQNLKLWLVGSDNSLRVGVTGLFNVEEFSISFAQIPLAFISRRLYFITILMKACKESFRSIVPHLLIWHLLLRNHTERVNSATAILYIYNVSPFP